MEKKQIVKLQKLSISKSELGKLNQKQRKQYVMLTCIIRDLSLLQKLVLFLKDDKTGSQALTSAFVEQSLILTFMLASKIHEAYNFLKKERFLGACPCGPKEILDTFEGNRVKIEEFFERSDIGIIKFIRDKFAFHYDTQRELDPMIDKAFRGLPEVTMWMSDSPANGAFTSTNLVIMDVLHNKAKEYEAGFSDNIKEFMMQFADIVLDGARVVSEFSAGCLVFCLLPVGWKRVDAEEVEAISYEDVIIPMAIARKEKESSAN